MGTSRKKMNAEQQRVVEYFKSYLSDYEKYLSEDPLQQLIESHTNQRQLFKKFKACDSWWCRLKRYVKFKIYLW